MGNKNMNTNRVKINKFVFIIILVFFVVSIYRLSDIALSKEIDGINIQTFASNRNTRRQTIFAQRGNIFDRDSNVLAQTVNSYTVVAVLDPRASEGLRNPRHVIDKKQTAEKLSPIINMRKETVLNLLNRNVYQVELGPGGRGISELTKQRIVDLELPGIHFISSYKRLYPNENFLSYVLGYVKGDDSGEMIGEMGIELSYNDLLKGENGYFEFQQDLNGFKIPNTPELRKDSVDGFDVYLTIDSNIQFFIEKATKEAHEIYSPDWIVTVVADAKTGEILGSTSYPSFNPNKRDMTNFLNPLVSFAYEPGSTMKTFTYMAAMEKGIYDGNKIFESGSIPFGNNRVTDWRKEGWGNLTFDQGFTLSANTAIANITNNYLSGSELRGYFEKLGFGSKTDINLSGEVAGRLNFRFPIEVANAGFGQGITTTPIQNVKALTVISNNGTLLNPYIVKKIVDPNTNGIVFEAEKQELAVVASESTVNNIKDLMYGVVHGDREYSTGFHLKVEGHDIIGKTGTAQYTNPATGRYYFDNINYIRSFAGMFPKDEPEFIVYTAMKRASGGNNGVGYVTRSVIRDIANYRGMFIDKSELEEINIYNLPNLLNLETLSAIKILKDNTDNIVIIGDGNKIVNQYPRVSTTVSCLDKIFLITNSKETEVPDLKGWSLKDVRIFTKLSNLDLSYEGTGFVMYQSVYGKIDDDRKINVILANKIKKE